MNKAILISRNLLGVVFVVFGLNYFLQFIPMPKSEGLPAQFMGALFVSKFLLVVKILEIAGGVLLLTKRFAPLGLVVLGPIVVNILLYDIFLAGAFNPLGALVLVLESFLIWSYRKNFAGIFSAPKS
jgi:uncharacterized membrane protein YphA (DoxX/SURF4 family)